jgi:cytochrome P450 family 619
VLAKLTLADDRVDGKFLPKGATILINAYGMHHDETRFPNPDAFDPDHYLGVTKLAPELPAAADYDVRDHVLRSSNQVSSLAYRAATRIIQAAASARLLRSAVEPIQQDFSHYDV